MKTPAKSILNINPAELECFVWQNRKWLAIWVGPFGRKMGHVFLYRKGKTNQIQAIIPQATRSVTLEEIVRFA